MAEMIKAGIDIGTNTILMVVGSVEAPDGEWIILEDQHRIARLGEGLDASGFINDDAIERASAILSHYRSLCSDLGVSVIDVVATSAIRNARNGAKVKELLEAVIGTPIDVLSGQDEAFITFSGVATECIKPSTVIDIGGGSTEYIAGFSRIVYAAQSLEFGAVRFTERYGLGSLPPSENIDKARNVVHRELVPVRNDLIRFSNADIIAVAGTPTSLAILDLGLTSYDKAKIEGHVLSAEAVTYWADRLLGMSQKERSILPGIDPKRVDILPAGALILDESLKVLEYQRCTVSVKGLRYGVMMR